MAKCDLAISVDRDAQALRPGERFAGQLTIGTDADVRCNALTLELRWVTDGKGDEDSKVIQTWELFAGDLRSGSRQAFPFEARIPRWGPVTYRGKILQVEWELRARADLPWAIDAKASLPLGVGNRAAPDASENDDDERYDPDGEDEEEADEDDDTDEDPDDDAAGATHGRSSDLKLVVPRSSTSKAPPKLVIGLVIAVVLAIALGAGMWRPLWGVASSLPRMVQGDVTWSDAPNLFFTLLILGLAAVIGWALGRQVLIKKRLGDVHCEITPERLCPGDSVSCFVRFTPQSSMDLSGITARLRAIEHCERGSGKSHRTFEHVALEQKVELAPGRPLSPGLPYEARGTLVLPADAAPSFWASDNELRWEVEVAIRMPRFPDWKREVTLSVMP